MITSIRVATVMIIAAFTFSAIAQNRREDQALPDDLYELYLKKSDTIEQAIKSSKNEWAGTYLAGTHHPTVFKLEPTAGFYCQLESSYFRTVVDQLRQGRNLRQRTSHFRGTRKRKLQCSCNGTRVPADSLGAPTFSIDSERASTICLRGPRPR